MIRPLLSAELFTNVCIPRYTDDVYYPLQLDCLEDNKTSIKLCGMRARKRSLELNDYKQLDREYLEKQEVDDKIMKDKNGILDEQEIKDLSGETVEAIVAVFNFFGKKLEIRIRKKE